MTPDLRLTPEQLEAASRLFEPVPDFPVAGITFRDISPLLVSPSHFQVTVKRLCQLATQGSFAEADVVLAIDARGFLFAAPLALEINKGLVMVRKVGKLPNGDVKAAQNTEYGSDVLTFQSRFVRGKKFFVVDDVVATGGTIDSVIQMSESCGGHYLGTLTVLDLKYCRDKPRPDIVSVFQLTQPAGSVAISS